jgi:hypothetical protein
LEDFLEKNKPNLKPIPNKSGGIKNEKDSRNELCS